MDFEDATKLIQADDKTAEESRGPERAYLVLLTGPSAGETFAIEEAVKLGRGELADIQLDADGLSRHHCTFLSLPDGRVVLRDNASTNGTFVNGERVAEVELRDGDKIQVATATILKFTYQDTLDSDFQQRMYDAALRDSLTKVFNKRYFAERMETEFAFHLRHLTPLSLVMLDLDHFKNVNDTWGHPAGDYVLRALADRVNQTIRTEDVLCRYGGEEFAVVCREIPTPAAYSMAERIRHSVEVFRFDWEGTRLPVTASLGVAGVPFRGIASPTDLIEAADQALYRAKHRGRNRVELFR